MNEISLIPLTFILAVHFIADFIFQTDEMAKNKSTSNYWLGKHILVYTAFLLPFGIMYALVNGILHFMTDYVSSRASKRQWDQGNVHNFFVVVGADQFFHVMCLVWTYPILSWWVT